MKFKIRDKGFTLLLSLLTMSTVLVASLASFNIIVKEIQLSGLNRESEIASYAAETGLECVEYWDIKMGPISTTSKTNISCAENSRSIGETTIISFDLALANGSCARVIIDKENPLFTKITSKGYNIGCDDSSPYKVERTWKVSY